MKTSMRSKTAALVLMGLFTAAPLAARAQNRDRKQGIPPGHLPPPGMCRVWYDGTPPGHQPASMSCREAERIAARDRNARVIYGGNGGRDDDRWGRDRDWERDRDRSRDRDAHPYGYPYPDRYPQQRYPDVRGGYNDVPHANGIKDGFDAGRNDARANRPFDPARQSRYRSADQGYNSRYGSKDSYKAAYRVGFRAGYDDGYREARAYGSDRRGGGAISGAVRRLPWPF
jgi:hypothetical protein